MRAAWALFVCFWAATANRQPEDDQLSGSFDDQLKTLERQFAHHLGIQRYHPMEVPQFKHLLDDTGITEELRTRTFNSFQDRIICGACQALIGNLQRNSISVEVVGSAICKLYISLNTWTLNDFCQQVVRVNKPILEYIVKNSKILTPEYACSVLLQNENCYIHHPSLTWRVDIPEGGPTLQNKMATSGVDRPLKILHLSDFHITHDYQVGGVSNCGYPVCCKRNLGNPLKGRDAGAWGDYNCDIPPWFYQNTLNFINNTHKDIDLIYFTGDVIDHAIWRASEQENAREIAYAFRQLAEAFPHVAVLPSLGNHESVPLNVFAPPHVTDPKLSQRWLYDVIGQLWSGWLPQEAVANVRKQGYFSVLANHKLRVIVLNNNVCYIYNWWLLYDTHFLQEQLEFLKNELMEAESRGQFVHIISHVYPGEKECVEPWEVNYNSLITRFSHIIKGQFFGHTHTDSFKVFYSKIDGYPNNVAFNGASLTPYTRYNPNYKIISVHPDTFDVLDIETYSFNLTEANLYPYRTPRWTRLYSMKEAWGLGQLNAEHFDWLAKRLGEEGGEMVERYWRFYVREGDASLREGCNEECRRELVGSLTRTESLST